MTRKNQRTWSHAPGRAMVTMLAAALVVVGTTSRVLGAEAKNSVRWTKEALAKLSRNQPRPVWQTDLQGQETDFIEFLSPDRVLLGTLETSGSGWGLAGKDVILLNATTGETIWTAPRSSFGSRQNLVAKAPVIVLQGSKKIGALNPKDGTLMWEHSWPEGRSLSLPDGNRIVLYSQKKDTPSLTAVNLKDGAVSWSASAENDPRAKVVSLGAKGVGGVVLLLVDVRSEPANRAMRPLNAFPMTTVVAFSDTSGHQLWRSGLAPGAVDVLGDDLYFIDGNSIRKTDPATGNQEWRQTFPGARMRNLTISGDSAYALLWEGNDGSSDAIQALERHTGKALWKCSLAERVQSAMVVEGDRIYVTTASQLIAVDASHKAIAWKTSIPPNLQRRRLLPDNLRVTDDRIVVAREIGVMGVQKRDGKVLFAESIQDGAAFTNDYATHTMAQAFESATPLKERPQVHEELADADATDMTRCMYTRMVLESQQQSFFDMASRNAARGAQQLRLQAPSRVAASNSTSAASLMSTNYTAASIVDSFSLVVGGAALGQSIGGAIMGGIVEGRISVMTAEVTQTFRTHASSLQGDFYIRPRYLQNRGWCLTVVNTSTGRRADVLLTPDNEPLAQYAPNLPAFAIDPSGSRILAKGLGLDPARYHAYEERGVFNPTGGTFSFAGFRGEMWSIPYPSILAFDLTSLPWGQEVENQRAVARAVSADKKALNDQLIAAAFQSDPVTVKNSLEGGADINATDEYGATALMLAAESLPVYRKNDIVELLVQHGAQVSLRDPHGWTAADYYAIMPSNAMNKVSKALKLLVKEGKKENEE
ncbi:MAG TPA: PQQ-binding-like beta-propeller repeat protein [Vicinamibacteria bacterium]|nr:PQQ-binding-like beta-propeller repeat protein [Vicinamibacteria bacterium]